MKQFKFVEKKNFWIAISLLILIVGGGTMINRSLNSKPTLNYGIDFVGGTTFLLKLNDISDPTSTIQNIRGALEPYALENSQVQLSNNNEIFIKTNKIEKDITDQVLSSLEKIIGQFTVLEIDFIGPSIGKALKDQSIWICITVSLALLAYITLRFEWSFGIAAVLAVLHDGLMIICFAALFNLEINTAFMAALLTVLGYSINDTIVIFDRIRERLNDTFVETSIKTITNTALNQTLVRTLNTSITTLLVILGLIFFGGTTIKEFCIVLLIGIVSGTYSSLCIASPIITAIYPKKDLITS